MSCRFFSIPLVLTAAVLAPNTRAVAATNTQTITLDRDLQIPGETLKPGAYTLAIEDHMQDRAIVRISSAGGGPHFLVLGVPNSKLNGWGDKGTILLGAADPSERILQGWLCPKCSTALELVYPELEAIEITKETGEPVLAVDPASDKLPSNLSPDDMKVVTLWLLSPEHIEPGHRGTGLKAAKYSPATSNADFRPALATHGKQYVLVRVIWSLVARLIACCGEQPEELAVLTGQRRSKAG